MSSPLPGNKEAISVTFSNGFPTFCLLSSVTTTITKVTCVNVALSLSVLCALSLFISSADNQTKMDLFSLQISDYHEYYNQISVF